MKLNCYIIRLFSLYHENDEKEKRKNSSSYLSSEVKVKRGVVLFRREKRKKEKRGKKRLIRLDQLGDLI